MEIRIGSDEKKKLASFYKFVSNTKQKKLEKKREQDGSCRRKRDMNSFYNSNNDFWMGFGQEHVE